MTQSDQTDSNWLEQSDALIALKELFPMQTIADRTARARSMVDAIIREKLQGGFVLHASAMSNSMAPLIRVGDSISLEWKPFSDLVRGEIVVYRAGGGYKVHRVISTASAGIITKGDANSRNDFPVSEDKYLGIVRSVNRNGKEQRLDSTKGKVRSMLFRHAARVGVAAGSPTARARDLVIRTSRFSAVEKVFDQFTDLGVRTIGSRLSAIPGVISVYVRRSYANGDYRPGFSDVDLTVVCRETSYSAVERIGAALASLQRQIPFLGEALLLSTEELRFWARFDRRGFETREWRLIAGSAVELPDYEFDPTRYGLDIVSELHHVSLLLGSALRKCVLQPCISPVLRQEVVKLLTDVIRYTSALSFDRDRLNAGIPTRRALPELLSDEVARAALSKVTKLLQVRGEDLAESTWRLFLEVHEWAVSYVDRFAEQNQLVRTGFACLPQPNACRRDPTSNRAAGYYAFENVQYVTLPNHALHHLSLATLRTLYREYDCVTSRLVICPSELFRAFAICSPTFFTKSFDDSSFDEHLRMLLRGRQVASLTALLHTSAIPSTSRNRLLLVNEGEEWKAVASGIRQLTDVSDTPIPNRLHPLSVIRPNALRFSMSTANRLESSLNIPSEHAVLSASLREEREKVCSSFAKHGAADGSL